MLFLYLAVATAMTLMEDGRDALCRGVYIDVVEPGPVTGAPFVTARELGRELDSLPAHAPGMLMSSLSPQAIKHRLEKVDKIEDVSVVTYTDGTIKVTATPIVPVMRVFDGNSSYYVNRAGKRVKASARYRADVPVVMGHFEKTDTVFTPLSLLPLIDFISADPTWSQFVSMIRVDGPHDIVLVPNIREHEINIGSPDNLDNKMWRLRRFYAEVLPVKGWDAYDHISLKWSGQVVATRRGTEQAGDVDLAPDDDEAVDAGTMLAGDDVAPGQALPGRKAHNEKPIPAAKNETKKEVKEQPQPTDAKKEAPGKKAKSQ